MGAVVAATTTCLVTTIERETHECARGEAGWMCIAPLRSGNVICEEEETSTHAAHDAAADSGTDWECAGRRTGTCARSGVSV